MWLLIVWSMREPPYVTSLRLPLSESALSNPELTSQLLAVTGVSDAIVLAEEGAAYVKVDTQQLDRAALDRLVA